MAWAGAPPAHWLAAQLQCRVQAHLVNGASPRNRSSVRQDSALPLVEGLMPHVSRLLEKGRFPGAARDQGPGPACSRWVGWAGRLMWARCMWHACRAASLGSPSPGRHNQNSRTEGGGQRRQCSCGDRRRQLGIAEGASPEVHAA